MMNLQKKNVCDDHRDTGLFTLLLRTDVPSLEVYDKSIGKYVAVESLVDPTDIIVYPGEKVPLFTGNDNYPATPHRVFMVPNTERVSVAFLLDVAK